MRILFLCTPWAVTREPARLVGQHPDLREGRHQWARAVGGPVAAPGDISFDMRRDTVREIARRCPGGPPDVMIVWALGYQALPPGIEDAPFPVVGCYSDWALLMPEQAGMLGACDYFFTCRGGVRVLRNMGFDNVEYWPMYGHDPLLSRVIEGVEKEWDIGLIGNLSAVVQRERAPWLARVARLAERYRVRIAGGVFNERYTRMLNATKITFNRAFRIPLGDTTRGAMNMRSYEAAACGSLLFCEEDNEEVREFFEDRVHCVLYNEQNLEELLDFYLTHDEERERITAAAVERVAEFSFPRGLVRLADRLEALDLPARAKSRRVRLLPAPELRKRHARQAAGTMTQGALQAARASLEGVLAEHGEDPEVLNDFAVINAKWVGEASGPEQARQVTLRSLEAMQRAVELCPNSAFFRLNLAAMRADTGWVEAAVEHAREAIALLDGGTAEAADPGCLPFPYTWDEYRVQFSLLYNASRAAPESFQPLWRCLLLYRAGMLLGEQAEALGLAELAALGYRIAVAARGDLGRGRVCLARALSALGQEEEALAQLEVGLEADPFLIEGWALMLDLLSRHGRERAARQFAAERLTMIDALQPPRERLAMSDTLSELEEVRRSMSRLLESQIAAA
jgi:tetratricopeptide (TPR) repeat protein